jgi:outer membrane lipoprotein-sorting protein
VVSGKGTGKGGWGAAEGEGEYTMPSRVCRHLFVSAIPIFVFISQSGAFGDKVGKKEFFDRLESSFRAIQTFQADVVQESHYPDGVVQSYTGKLVIGEDQRISYDYELTGQYLDSARVQEDPDDTPPPGEPGDSAISHPAVSTGAYRTMGENVIHYVPEQNVLLEGPESENLLIQVFRALIGAGEFDVEKFKEEHKVLEIREEEFEGVPVLGMIAEPKKDSALYEQWRMKSRNELFNWRQELWVKRSNMEPVKAVLHSTDESTSVRLKNVRVNQPVDPRAFLVETGNSGVPPVRIPRGQIAPSAEWIQAAPVEKPLREIPLEDPFKVNVR